MKKKVVIILSSIIVFFILLMVLIYNLGLGAVSSDSSEIEFVIDEGSTYYSVIDKLKEENLIKNKFCFKIYIKLNKKSKLEAGTYKLNKNMNVKEIVELFDKGNTYNPNVIEITFKEGLNIRGIATIIGENTDNTYDSVLDLLKDETYLNEVIKNYWFITEDIKNKDIYYSLEGYLFPDTYQIDKTSSVKDIFKIMLDRMEKELNNYKKELKNSKFSVHEILTLASVIEKEGKTKDFQNISSVFHNRLDINKKLESCATTFYGMGLDFNEVGIATSEMTASDNPYNTYKIAGLPIGPIASPGKSAIEAAIKPNKTDYVYFLSDNEGVTYFFKTYKEHQLKQFELINQGKWYR